MASPSSSSSAEVALAAATAAADRYLADVIPTLRRLTELFEGGTITWEGDIPSQFSPGVVLDQRVRSAPVLFSTTPQERHPTATSHELLDQFVKDYEHDKRRWEDTSTSMMSEILQMRRLIAGDQRGIAPRLVQLIATSEVRRRAGVADDDGELSLVLAGRKMQDALRLLHVDYKPAVEKSQTSWFVVPFFGKKPVTKWSREDARVPWIESMNLLLDPLVAGQAFTLADMPTFDQPSEQLNYRPHDRALQPLRIGILARSARHLVALAEIHRLSILRVQFTETPDMDAEVVLKGGTKTDERARNVTRALSTLYHALVEFGRVPTAVQQDSGASAFMLSVAAVTLTYEHFTQVRKQVPRKNFDDLRRRVVGAVSPARFEDDWETWIPLEREDSATWHRHPVFSSKPFRALRERVTRHDAELRATFGQVHDFSWNTPIDTASLTASGGL